MKSNINFLQFIMIFAISTSAFWLTLKNNRNRYTNNPKRPKTAKNARPKTENAASKAGQTTKEWNPQPAKSRIEIWWSRRICRTWRPDISTPPSTGRAQDLTPSTSRWASMCIRVRRSGRSLRKGKSRPRGSRLEMVRLWFWNGA